MAKKWMLSVLGSCAVLVGQSSADATSGPPVSVAPSETTTTPATGPQEPATAVPTSDWNEGEEPRADFDKPQPGAIEPPIELINRDPSNWFGIPPDKEWLNLIRDPLKSLNEKTGLQIAGAYSMLFQQSIGPNATSAAAGDVDLTARWTFLGRDTPDTGSIYVAGEYRFTIGDTPPSALGGEIGTLTGTTNGFNGRGWAVKDLYYVQRLFDDHFRFGIGRVDAENLVGAHDLQSANTSFLNKAFSFNPTMAFPGSGMGLAATVRPLDWFYVSGGASNAYGNTTQITIDDLDKWRFFKFVELGVTPDIEGWGPGKYRIAFWHMDSRELTDQPSDGGFTLIADQKFGERISLFARYGYDNGNLTNIKQSAQLGGAIQGLVGSDADLTGLALSWSQPTADLRDEKVMEVFHRLQLTGRTQLTFGMQLIIDPSNAPDVDALGVFSTRLRVTF